jgi:hypothetical protein
MGLFLSPDRLDAAVNRAPLLLLGGLALAIASPAWGGAGAISGGAAAWSGVLGLVVLEWRTGGARLLALLCLLPTLGLVALVFNAISVEAVNMRIIDLGMALALLLSRTWFLVSVLLSRRAADQGMDDEPTLNVPEAMRRRERYPGHQGIQPPRNGIHPGRSGGA